MNKEVIKKYKLDEAVKRFNQINEYTFITAPTLSEDGEDDNNVDTQMDGGNEQQSDNQQMNSNADAPSQAPADPQLQGNDASSAVSQMDNNDIPQGNEDVSDEDFDVETEEMEPDDEVIDVDDLTNAQETTQYKVDDVNDKLTTLLKVVNKFTDAIEQNDKKIEDLKNEFEKRNPTPEEKLNIRSQGSYPYSETPRGYWDKKSQEDPHYNVMYDNDVPASEEQKKFEIKQKDIDNFNYKEISDSFDEPLTMNQFIRL